MPWSVSRKKIEEEVPGSRMVAGADKFLIKYPESALRASVSLGAAAACGKRLIRW